MVYSYCKGFCYGFVLIKLFELEHGFMLTTQIGQILMKSKSDHSGAWTRSWAISMPNLESVSLPWADQRLEHETMFIPKKFYRHWPCSLLIKRIQCVADMTSLLFHIKWRDMVVAKFTSCREAPLYSSVTGGLCNAVWPSCINYD